jgi:hypothetical protein
MDYYFLSAQHTDSTNESSVPTIQIEQLTRFAKHKILERVIFFHPLGSLVLSRRFALYFRTEA